MRLIAVTTCTNRKKFPVPAELEGRRLSLGSQSAVADAWRKRIKCASTVALARDVYCGRSFQEAATAARTGQADFRIISGGVGLVRADQTIPSYSLSLVRQSSDFVGMRVEGSFDAVRWWSQVQQGPSIAPLAELIHGSPDAIALVAISTSYLTLIEEDLASLDEDDLDRVRLIGMGVTAGCAPRLRRCILPYDDRIDGPDSNIRGTRGDFSSRAMRHFIERVLPETRSKSIRIDIAEINRCLERWRRPKLISRLSKPDEEIIKLIRMNWKAIDGKSSLGLRYLRDVENVACEQGRYRSLFHRAAKQVE